MKSMLLVLSLFTFVFAQAQASTADYSTVAEKFLKEKCSGIASIESENYTSVVRPVALGYEDVIYTINYSVRWYFDGTHPIAGNPLTLKIVSRAEGDMFVFAGSQNSDICDFTNLPTYSE